MRLSPLPLLLCLCALSHVSAQNLNSHDLAVAKRKFLVDRYGQSARKDYPGKVASDDELKADIEKQKSALGTYAGPALDRFGGLAGSGEKLGLKKTGFFHTALIGPDRHILVTPEGNAFFQLSVCGIANTDDYTTVKGREKTYEWLPDPKDPAWRTAWRDQRPDWGIFSFQIANWIRKYGKPYSYEEWTGQAVGRLRAWGFNSDGAFSNYSRTMSELNFPTVAFLPSGGDEGVKSLPDKVGVSRVMDPFAPGAEAALDRAYARSVADRAGDPLLIGYFLGNEQHFEILPKLIVGYKASAVPAKAKLVEVLRERHGGDIARFNAAWEPVKPFASFDELGEATLFIRTDAAATDMRAFHQLYLESYYGMIRRVFKKHDPNHLLIGSRWTPNTANHEDTVRIGGKYLDVISINYYTYGIEKDFLKKVYDWSGGRPMLFSEWYFSSTEHGLGGGKEVKDQAERGLAYRNYIEQAAATGFVVGSQWFLYSDQSITGRFFEGFNGEGNNTGFVDVTDRPYAPLVNAARATHARIYDVLLGKEKPFVYDDARFSGQGVGGAKIVSIPPAPPTLRFDGSTSGWPGRPAEPIGADRVMIGNPDPKLGGAFRLAWDERGLRFLIQVKDPTPAKNNKPPASYWLGDGIELFIGSKNLVDGGALQFSDRQILIGAGDKPGVSVVDHPEAGAACRVLVVKEVSGDGYTLQVELPWSVLGFTPKAGMEFLFDVAIDNSADGETRLQQLVWNGTGKNSGDRGAWGRARLVEN
ncbi:MAG TPA: sugar-binding protein [Rariglobus sp.]|nr:sugar-binding protein [Rariglobus sp.]